MSFDLKQIDGAVVEKVEHSEHCAYHDYAKIGIPYKGENMCNCDASGMNDGIDAQASVRLRLNREKLLAVLKRSEVGLVVKGYYDSHLWDEKFNDIADAIIAADKDIIEVEK